MSDKVIVASQRPGSRAITVEALKLNDGSVAWSFPLGGEITSLRRADGVSVLRSDAGQLIAVDHSAKEKPHRLLNVPATGNEFAWMDQKKWIVRFEASDSNLQVIDVGDTSCQLISEHPIGAPPVTQLSIRSGELRFDGKSPVTVSGDWAALVDEQSRLQIYQVGRRSEKNDREVIYHQLKHQSAGALDAACMAQPPVRWSSRTPKE